VVGRSATYKVTAADAGRTLTLTMTVTLPGQKPVTTAKAVTVTVPKIVPRVTVKKAKGGKLTVTVKAGGVKKPTGKITIRFSTKVTKAYTLKASKKGKLTVRVPGKVKHGTYKVKATYKGTAQIAKKTATKRIAL
jgi:hypothetical protein